MKRFLLPGLLALALAQPALAQISSTFNNNVFYQIPPQPGTIDATNFVNTGVFSATVPLDLVDAGFTYFQTSDTLNFTNTGTMIGNPGFDFEFFPTYFIPPKPGVPFNNMAANFVNQHNGLGGGGAINCNGQSTVDLGIGIPVIVFGNTKFIVAATNIVNSGEITLDTSEFLPVGGAVLITGNAVGGQISLTGENVDLRGGKVVITSSTTNGALFLNSTFGVSSLDYGFGTDTNADWDPGLELNQGTAISSFYQTVRGSSFQMVLSNSIPYSFTVSDPFNPNNTITRSIFLQDTSPNVIKNAYFRGAADVGAGAAHVEWAAPFIDPVTGAQLTNYLYLSDLYAAVTVMSVTNPFFAPNGVPGNYSFAEGTAPLILGPPEVPVPAGNFPLFNPGIVTNLYSYLDAQLIPTLNSTNSVFGANITNLPQRIQISASRTLNLADAQISGPDYFSVNCTNQFEGNAGIVLSAPLSDLSLGRADGFLTISNLMKPTLPLWTGRIQAFTGRWLETFSFTPPGGTQITVTNDNRVLLVNSKVFPTTVPQIQDLTLHATNTLTISDSLNVFRKLSIDARTLTITTNGPGSYSSSGQLNFQSPSILWSASLPNLKFLTNWGIITSGNTIFFAGNMFSPYSDPNAATSYETFVNHGVVTNLGSFIVVKYFLNDGVFQTTPSGNFTLSASCALLTNGMISAVAGAGNVSIACNSLVVSNHSLQAGAALTLSATNCITDGYPLFNQFGHTTTTNAPTNGGVTNGNSWMAGGSFSTTINPVNGDLLGTTMTNSAISFANFSVWAGQDRGPFPAGYTNNIAIGQLILDGTTNGHFTFAGVGASNALYVDTIVFQGSTSNYNSSGIPSINISPNLRIYYAQAIAGGISIAEKLAGLNNGRFCWVSNYAGIFGSTNMQYPDGSWHTFNKALVEATGIDSNGNGTVNKDDPAPIPTSWVFDNVAPYDPCDCPAVSSSGSGSGSGSGGGGSGPSVAKLPPLPVSPAGIPTATLFSDTKGSYNGLFYETNGITVKSAGYFSASTTAKGGFSAQLKLGGKSYSFSGQLDSTGRWSKTNAVKLNASTFLGVSLQLDSGGSGQLTGRVTDGHWTAGLLAQRAAYNKNTNPAPQKGQYTLVVPGDDEGGVTGPAGHGAATVKVDGNGAVQMSGALGDGTTISQNTALSSQGIWPLYSSLYNGAGLVIGWIQFANQPESDLAGVTVWEKNAGVSGKYYKSGFTNVAESAGSRYTPPPLSSANAVIILSGGNLPGPVTNNVVLNSSFKAANQGANKLSLTITPSSGSFKGSLANPLGWPLSFQGVLLEKSGMGAGFFLGTNQSGQVIFNPAP